MSLSENNEERNKRDFIYSLISIDEFKSLMGIDDRDDKLCRFCLVTSTLTIEEYCKRKFLRKQYFETLKFRNNYLLLTLKEYPVIEILLVSAFTGKQFTHENGMIIESEFYRPMFGNGYNEEMLFELLLSPSLKPYEFSNFNVSYIAGYGKENVPSDLQAACLELASWNINRYKGKRIGMSGNIRGAGIQGEHYEMSMPENVKALIEPYKRKTI